MAFKIVGLRQSLYLLITALCSILLLTGMVNAESEVSSATPEAPPVSPEVTIKEEAEGIPLITSKSGRTVLLFPSGDFYPPYIADPRTPRFGIQWMIYSKTTIPDTGNSRFGLEAGGSFGIVSVHPADQTNQGWQLSIKGGFDAQFDIYHSEDNIGWDGIYGLLLTTAQDHGFAYKLSMNHDSSHVGDEYEARTGRQRIGYTREEIAAGISWSINNYWRAYAEAGWGYHLGNENLQKPGRLEFGLEYESTKSLWEGRAGWYTALDISSMQERDWRVDTSFQMGFVFRSGERTWRLGIERCDGPPPIGEFFQYTESYIALGLWIDI